MAEKIDDFLESSVTLSMIIFDYYLNFIPYFANLFTPLFVFIAVIFFTSKMAYQTEIIAILSSGVSFRRLLVPYLLGAAIIGSFSFVLGAYVIPPANRVRLDFENTYIKKRRETGRNNIHMQIEPDVFVYVRRYSSLREVGDDFSLEIFDGKRLLKRSEEHTSELQSRPHLVCRLLLEKKKQYPRLSLSSLRLAPRHLVALSRCAS